MHERTVEIATADGQMPTFVTHPEAEGRHPAVVLYMDALGIREELKDMARRIGTVGYYVLLPNLFYRDGGPSFDPALLPTRGPDPEMMRLNHALSHAQVLADTRALLDFLAAEPAASRGAMAAIGWCMGGRAWRSHPWTRCLRQDSPSAQESRSTPWKRPWVSYRYVLPAPCRTCHPRYLQMTSGSAA